MKPLSRLLCLALVVAFVSCSGGGTAIPVVRDYTNGNPSHDVKPQSVRERCPPNQPCGGGGDGGGGGGIGGVYGTQGSCDTGYLNFSDGCEDDGADPTVYVGWINWPVLNSVAIYHFDDEHFWNRHLACYVHSTNLQFDAAVTYDFDSNHYEGLGDPPPGTGTRIVFTYTDVGGSYSITYGIYHLTSVQAGVVLTDYYNVGTAFIRGRPNCPGY